MSSANKRTLILLGSFTEVGQQYLYLRQNFPNLQLLQCSYTKKAPDVKPSDFCRLTPNREIDSIKQHVSNKPIAVFNRADSYIPVWAKIIDEFQLPGSSYNAVMQFKNKASMHKCMQQLGLHKHRPKTTISTLTKLHQDLKSVGFSVVVKPVMGAKSRGVFIVKDFQQLNSVAQRLKTHFQSHVRQRNLSSEPIILLEKFIQGQQVTCTAYIDKHQQLHVIGFESVTTGRDIGQLHQQLVFRTAPTTLNSQLTQSISAVLTKIIQHTKLQSTFIFPDIIISNHKWYLIELNIRLGGFRQELYHYSRGIDLLKAGIQLALGESPRLLPTKQHSATAVELWEDKSGVVQQLEIPRSKHIHKLRTFFNPGQKYTAPPQEQTPLARFYVTHPTNSLALAIQLKNQTKIKLE